MKREFLENLKIGEQALPKEIIDVIMEENGKDIEGMQKTAKEWEAKYNKAISDHATEMDTLDLDSVVKDVIRAAGGRNEKAVRALMDMEALRASKKRREDAEAAVKALKDATETRFLFGEDQTPPPYSAGTGSNGNRAYSAEDSLRAAMGLPAKK